MAKDLYKPASRDPGTEDLLHSLRELIEGAVKRLCGHRHCPGPDLLGDWPAYRRVEQGGSARAEYGTRLLPILAESLGREFGRGFDVSNLRHMRVFYLAFPIRDALRPELS